MEKVLKVYKIFKSYLRIIGFKIIYGSRFKVNFTKKIYFGKNTNLFIGRDGKFLIRGNFICRDNNHINIKSGILKIGNNVFFNNGNSINCHENIYIGNDTILGEGIKIYDHDHNIESKKLIKDSGFRKEKVKIGNNIWIGSNVLILKGTQIEDNCVIGAGSIIKEIIPKNNIVFFKREKVLRKIMMEK